MLLLMIRPLCKWHLIMAFTLLEVALIYTSFQNEGQRNSQQERRLQQVLARTREVAGALKETQAELEALLWAERQKEEAMRLLDLGHRDLERQIARLRAFMEAS